MNEVQNYQLHAASNQCLSWFSDEFWAVRTQEIPHGLCPALLLSQEGQVTLLSMAGPRENRYRNAWKHINCSTRTPQSPRECGELGWHCPARAPSQQVLSWALCGEQILLTGSLLTLALTGNPARGELWLLLCSD